MELKKGFKQTEIGVIPEDWEMKSIVEIAKYNDAGIKIGPFGSALKKELLVNKGYKVYGQENIFDNDLNVGNRYITKSHFKKLKSCEIISGDFLISMMGTIGKSMIVPEKFERGIMDSHLIRVRIDEEVSDINYFKYYFSHTSTLSQIKSLSVGGIMDGLSSKIIKKIQIPLPPTLEEQQAISNVLSDTDQLIQNLKTLIAKKKAIKQGAMQELLTGKKRLQGFTEEWETKKVGEIASFFKGKSLSKSQIDVDGKFKCIHYGELFTKYSEVITQIINKTNLTDNVFLSKVNDVLMPTSDVTPNGLATASCINENDVILGGDILVIRFASNVLNGIFFSYLVTISKDKIMQLVTGSTVYHLYGSDMANFELSYPNNIKEQHAIAQILSDMDTEIETLEQKLQKTQALKQGMMQELLTGKTRLVKPVTQEKIETLAMVAEPEVIYKKIRNKYE